MRLQTNPSGLCREIMCFPGPYICFLELSSDRGMPSDRCTEDNDDGNNNNDNNDNNNIKIFPNQNGLLVWAGGCQNPASTISYHLSFPLDRNFFFTPLQ